METILISTFKTGQPYGLRTSMNETKNTANEDFFKKCHSGAVTTLLVSKFPSSLAYAVHLTACVLSIIGILTTICLNSLTCFDILAHSTTKRKYFIISCHD